MAQKGIISIRFIQQIDPKCPTCAIAKATRRPWRFKTKKLLKEKSKLKPGQVISIDQMTTTTPGYIAQMTGIPTEHRYTTSTIYVDHATRYAYIHLQTSTDAENTLEGKVLFEQHMATLGHQVKHYHTDNGIFAANKWRDSYRDKGQILTFAGV